MSKSVRFVQMSPIEWGGMVCCYCEKLGVGMKSGGPGADAPRPPLSRRALLHGAHQSTTAVFNRAVPVHHRRGLSASIISNYFKGVFAVDAVQRGLLEIPRELPGVVCVLVIAALPTLGSLSLSLLGFGLYFVGLFVLGLLSPSYAVMQLFVFTYSMGDHMFMPLRDVIAMDLSEEGKTGTFLGTYRSVMTVASMAASALVFVGFRAGFFYFRPDSIVPTFCLAMVILAAAIVCLCRLRGAMPALDVRKREAAAVACR